MTTKITTIKDLITCLDQQPKITSWSPRLAKQIALSTEEIKNYTLFKKERYTRNLIYKNEHYEIMTLCWLPNQETAIHDHNKSEGWMTVIKGKVIETSYNFDLLNTPPLKKTTDILMSLGDSSYINDDIGCHSIKCNPNTPSITLHLYTPPIVWCSVFDKKTTQMKKKMLSFDTPIR